MAKVNAAESFSIARYQAENARLVKLLGKAVTQEPKSGEAAWVDGSRNNMHDVITFRQNGVGKGSLERMVEANHLPKAVYDRLRSAVAAGAHKQKAAAGVVKFDVTPESMAALKEQLDQFAISRDKDHNKKLEGKELASFKKLDNGKAATAPKASEALAKVKLADTRTEHKFSRQVNYVMDLLYSNGNIYGPDHVENIAKDLPKAKADAVRQAYAAVSRYMSRGETAEKDFICMDQRREVQRGLMRVFGGALDETERLIGALKLPRGY